MTPANRRRSARPRPHVGWIGLGLLAVLAGFPVVAQTINRPAAPPDETPLAPSSEPSPTTSTAAPPQPPASPFGASPGVFPTISPAPLTPEQQVSPFGAAPGVFPGISPAPSTSATPEQPAPGGVSPAPSTSATPQQPISPFPGITPPGTAAPAPLTPGYGFGVPLGPVAGAATGAPAEPPAAPTSVGLQPLRPGALPVQSGDSRAPPILITPKASLSEGYTDNPRNTPNTLSDSVTHLNAGSGISVDSVRLKGQLSGSVDYRKYARATDLDTLNANLLGFGLATVVPDHVFVDGRATITQLSRTGGVGFANSTVIPPSQQTQAEILSLTPIVRESIDGYVDSELRYNYGLSLFQNGSLLKKSTIAVPPSAAVPSTSLSNTTSNEATLSLATGRRFTFLGSKLTLDAKQIDAQSAAKSTQLRGFDDVEYQFNQELAALARAGYEDLRFPLQPAATTAGPTWLLGGRLTPFPGSYLVIRYGRQDGFYGVSSALRYQATPATTILASLENNLSSIQGASLANLNSSQVDANGNVVNQVSGLPSALTNPEFSAASNNIFRNKNASIGMQTQLDRDNFGIFGVFNRRSALATPTVVTGIARTLSGSDSSVGVNLNWNRTLMQNLGSAAQLGYAIAQAAHSKTLTADLSLNYTMTATLTALLHYQFINVESAIVAGSYRRNLLEIGVTRSF